MNCATVSIIGRPSAGKSTLLNALCGHKVSITAGSPQTTRNAIRGIVTESRGQLIFTDTPGYHVSDKKLNVRLQNIAVSALSESDVILYVIDALRKPGKEEAAVIELLSTFKGPIIVALNKCDKPKHLNRDTYFPLFESLSRVEIVETSAVTKDGLELLRTVLFQAAPEGDILYPEDYYTDQPPQFRAAEIIREKAVAKVSEELPHAIYVEVADMEPDDAKGTLWIRAFIIVERESQKGIIVGKGGAGIKAIRQEAQKELNQIFTYRVHLDLRVKAQAKWRNNDHILSQLIH